MAEKEVTAVVKRKEFTVGRELFEEITMERAFLISGENVVDAVKAKIEEYNKGPHQGDMEYVGPVYDCNSPSGLRNKEGTITAKILAE